MDLVCVLNKSPCAVSTSEFAPPPSETVAGKWFDLCWIGKSQNCFGIVSNTYESLVCTPLALEPGAGAEPNTILEATGSCRGVKPNGFMIFQNILRYQRLLSSVIPKRAKNTTAMSGLIHWVNLTLETNPGPLDIHSSAVTLSTTVMSEWTAFQPGQKGAPCTAIAFTTKLWIATGNVMRISNKPSTKILEKLCLSSTELLARSSSSSLCLK